MPRYDWATIQRFYDAGHSYHECMERFGFSPCAWIEARRRGVLQAYARQLAAPFFAARCKARRTVRKRLLEEGILRHECYECGITHWFGKALTLQLDHINGINDDNRIENLRMLCPNCHSQTDTFSGKNRRKRVSFLPAQKKYDWTAVQRYYDEGHSVNECRLRFGFARGAWTKARNRGDLSHVRPRKKDLFLLLRQSKHRTSIKRRLLAEGLLRAACYECGISEWRGKPLSVQIDHINGINDDYRLENLRMLCPNCHSLTETHGHRNRKPLACSELS